MAWCGLGVYCNDPDAFLFSVVNPRGDGPVLFSSTADGYSIYCASSYGPIFRRGADIIVGGDTFQRCYTNLTGACYAKGSAHGAVTVFTGDKYFKLAQLEVWQM